MASHNPPSHNPYSHNPPDHNPFVHNGASDAPSFLAMPATAYFVVAGARLLAEDHTGPLYRLVRASDSATLDVYATATGLPDYAAISTWIGASSAKFDRLYLQDNSGAYAAQTTDANRPIYDATRAVNGCAPIVFDGAKTSWGTIETPRNKYLDLPALGFDRQDLTVLAIMAPTVSRQANAFVHLKAGATHILNLATDWATGGLCSGIGAASIQTPSTPPLAPLNPTTSVYVSDATSERYYTPDAVAARTAAARTSAAITGGAIGFSGSGLGEETCADFWGFGIGEAVTDAEAKALIASANATCGFKGAADWTSRTILVGDSNIEGYFATANKGTGALVQRARPATELVYSLALGGRDLAATYADRAALLQPHITGALPTTIVVETIGQDMLDGDTAAQAAANMLLLRHWLAGQAGPPRLVVCTPTLVNPGAVPASVLTYGQAYGEWAARNAMAASAIVVPTGDATLGNSALTTDTTYYGDGFHLTSTTAAIYAALISSGIDAAALQPTLYPVVAVPSGFTDFAGRPTVMRVGSGASSTFLADFDYEISKPTINATLYVDSVSGNNANAGTSQGAPLRSLSTAITKANALAVATVLILVRTDSGRAYWRQNSSGTTLNDHFNGVAPTCDIIVEPDPTYGTAPILSLAAVPGTNAGVYTWTQIGSTGCYSSSPVIASARGFIDLATLDASGDPVGLVRVTSVANTSDPSPELIAADALYGRGAYYQNGATASYVRMHNGRAPDGDLAVSTLSAGNLLVSSAASRKVWLKRVKSICGTYTFAMGGSGSTVNHELRASECAFIGAGTDPGGFAHKTGGGSLLIFDRCRASYNLLDGFNYHGANTSVSTCPAAVEIDCAARGNGDGGGGTNNGTTLHEYARAAAVNGTYETAQDRVVHDINSAQRWMLGSAVNAPIGTTSASGLVRAGNDATQATQIWLDAVRFGAISGSQFHIDALAAATVKYANMDATGWVLPGAGSVTSYTP